MDERDGHPPPNRPLEIEGEGKGAVTPDERALLSKPSERWRTELGRIAHRRQRRLRKRLGWFFVFLGGAGVLLVAVWLLRGVLPESFPTVSRPMDAREQRPLGAYALYYSAQDGSGLIPEVRYLPQIGDLAGDVRAVIVALLEGPLERGSALWPEEVVVHEIFVSTSGIAYVNFSGSLRWLLPAGDYAEWAIIGSLTRTLCDNFPLVRGVRILVDGEATGALGSVMPLDRTYRPAMFAQGGVSSP